MRVGQQLGADAGRAAALVDVRLVLVAEPPQRAEHRVRRRLAQAAEAGVLDRLGQTASSCITPLKPLERVEALSPAVGRG